ncbi:glycosyltransferase family 4 protein [Pueribacillus theae]|uniref:glycosyltransferase family 4 protein n=1 Tax=Pueribacillus theae TaxID=2171751 RepID=UPI001F0C9C18|nr:MraY family glycosyltransferase [Pueribacillus theae]
MLDTYHYFIAFFISLLVTIIATPFVKKIALRYNIVDKPENRKIHMNSKPRLGGLAIVIGVAAGYLYLTPAPYSPYMPKIIIGAIIITIVGILDDKFTLSPKAKLLGQIIAACIVVSSGLLVDFVTIPFYGKVEFGVFSYAITILWIVGITNAMNLIDGLDGLSAGVSTIALTFFSIMAVIDSQFVALGLSIIFLGATIGFLFFNFHPAEIFMGDTGALFLGYSISIISILGLFKSVTLFSLIIPVIILAVPIFDTFFAIIRRLLNKQKISSPDRRHLHHRLIDMGFSHKTTVFIIYGVSIFFGISALVFSASTLWGSLLMISLLLLILQLTAELIGLIGEKRKPIVTFLKRLSSTKPATKPVIKRE